MTYNGVGVEIPDNLFFYDIDAKPDECFALPELHKCCVLAYRTKNGMHIFCKSKHRHKDYLVDPNCPHTIVRIFPNSDYKLVRVYRFGHVFTDFLAWSHGFSSYKPVQCPTRFINYFSFPKL